MKKIKNGFVIIDSSTIEEIKNIRQSEWGGFFYVVEWGCNQVKNKWIGWLSIGARICLRHRFGATIENGAKERLKIL